MHADAVVAALTGLALFAGHHLGDYWAQTDHQAMTKGECSHAGRTACAGHVATLTAAQGLLLVLVLAATGAEVSPAAAALALGLNAASHYWADRRRTLRGLVLALEPLTSKSAFYDNGGAAHLDQAFHIAWIIPAALIAAAPLPLALALSAAGAALLGLAALASARALRTDAASV